MVVFGNDWDKVLDGEFEKEYYLKLREFLKNEYKCTTIFPPMDDIFNALKFTSYENTKVVILGQDPYIRQNEAHGLSFSVQKGVRLPPSLLNIYKEIVSDIGGVIPSHGHLVKWCEQGVMLLNTVLTVRGGNSNSHKGKGWEIFTDRVISCINEKKEPAIFMLWGNNAIAKKALVTNPQHLVLTAKHPSPLAGGAFFGCKHFSKANEFLKENGRKEIDWQID